MQRVSFAAFKGFNMASRKFCRTDYMLSIKKEYKAKTPEISRSLGFCLLCAHSVTAQTRTGRPVAPLIFGQAAKRIAPAGAT